MINYSHTYMKLLQVFHKFFTANAKMLDGLGTQNLWTEETKSGLSLEL